ncbi:MAG TPA: FkbM family methyltransferase [Gemmataceae bacterium]|jgi:FkbM family methyltransferase
MIQKMCLQIFDRRYEIRYPHSPLMVKVIRDTLGGEYPFLPFLKEEQGTILDVGANIGCASLLFATLYPRTGIYAFEPARESYDLLVANTQVLPNIRPFNIGLLDRDGSARLFRGSTISATNSLGRCILNTEEYEEVALRRISSFLRETSVEHITLLKLDTEGAEVPILRDLGAFLGHISALHLEYHSEQDRCEIDQLLSGRFMLHAAQIHHVHRGVLTYVAKDVIQTRTDLDKWAITRPLVS